MPVSPQRLLKNWLQGIILTRIVKRVQAVSACLQVMKFLAAN
jgi:hypothetical protein